MNPHLFVYGTLQRSFDNAHARHLHSSATFLAEAHMPGKLYLLGNENFPYPAATHDPQESAVVRGELWSLNDPAATLALLDDYEGTTPTTPPPHEYIRQEILVHTRESSVLAWVYLLNLDVDPGLQIPSGEFSAAGVS